MMEDQAGKKATSVNVNVGPPPELPSCFSRRSKVCCLCVTVVFVIIVGSVALVSIHSGLGADKLFAKAKEALRNGPHIRGSTDGVNSGNDGGTTRDNNMPSLRIDKLIPQPLIGVSYFRKDFVNDAGVAPTFWNCSRVEGECQSQQTWGPCYIPSDAQHIEWLNEVQKHEHGNISNFSPARYPDHEKDVAGYCRPGFIILGAGKCGTSSLYHYLTSHPRVLKAREKQIHYFKYHPSRSMKWYLAHFATTVNFLASGALMTGEASPGYLPYPNVVSLMADRLPGARLIVLGRNPIDRTFSSYRYSYVVPTIAFFRAGKVPHVPRNLTDEQYQEKYLFSFEDTIAAELKALRKCLAPNGTAIIKARAMYGQTSWGQKLYQRREKLGLPPPADMDGFCYGKRKKNVLRPQWKELMEKYPEKVIVDHNTHLLQSHLGRSLYVNPVEWWYALFPQQDLFFMCTESLSDLSGKSMEPLRQWLGLPVFNFSETLQKGAFNVGGHRGYDKEVAWDEAKSHKDIPLSPQFRQELQEFIEPFNERLFDLIGKRCDW